jgi:hypothetical protein
VREETAAEVPVHLPKWKALLEGRTSVPTPERSWCRFAGVDDDPVWLEVLAAG